MKKLAVVIPALNEAKNIGNVIKQVPKTIAGLKSQVIVVDDGSTDDTADVAQKAGATVVSHAHNQGVGQAFQTGLAASLQQGATIMVNIDADGQFSPKEIPQLIKPILDKKADFVASDRFYDPHLGKLRKPDNMPTSKYYGNMLIARLISFLAGQQFNDVSCGFRAYNRHAMLTLNLTGKFTYTQESFLDLATKGIRIDTVPVSVKYFPERKSRVANNLFTYAIKTLKIIIRSFRDHKPMIFFFYLSLIPLIISLFTGIFSLTHYLNTGQITPYKAIGFASIYFFSLALLLLIVGFLADMFVRLRINQEKILYNQKTVIYEKSTSI